MSILCLALSLSKGGDKCAAAGSLLRYNKEVRKTLRFELFRWTVYDNGAVPVEVFKGGELP